MAEIIEFDINVNTDTSTTKTLGDIKQEFKDLQKEVLTTERGTDDYYKALKRLGETKNDLDGMRDEIRLLSKDTIKLDAFIKTGQGIAGAFSAGQGALALFGGESEALQETLVKVNAAMAISQGIDAFGNSYRSLVPMLSVLLKTKPAIDSATTSTNRLGLAFKGIGIGLIVSALVFMISNWEKLKEVVTDLFPALKNTGDLFNEIKTIAMGVGNALLEFVVAPIKVIIALFTDGIEGAVEQFKASYNVVNNFEAGVAKERVKQAEQAEIDRLKSVEIQLEREIKLRQARGQETIELERKLYATRLQISKENAEEVAKIELDRDVFEARLIKQREDEAKRKADERLKALEEAKKKEADLIKSLDKIEADLARERELQLATDIDRELKLVEFKYEEQLRLLRENGRDTSNLLAIINTEQEAIRESYRLKEIENDKRLKAEKDKLLKERIDSEFEALELAYNQRELALLQSLEQGNLFEQEFNVKSLNNLIEVLEQEVQLRKSYGLDATQFETELVNARINLSNMEAQAKEQNAMIVAGALNALAQLAGQNTVLGKALGVASATVDTYVGANKALATYPPPFGAIAAAGVVAQGLNSVRQITKTKVPNVKGVSVGNVSAPSINIPNIRQSAIQATQTQLSEIDRDLLNRPVVAQVVETEVTNTQNRVRNIERNASF